MHSLLSFIKCYLVNLDTYQVGLLEVEVSHSASPETCSIQKIVSGKSYFWYNLKIVCEGCLRVVNFAIKVRNAKHNFLPIARIELTNKLS